MMGRNLDRYLIDGTKFSSLSGFHEEARRLFDFGQYYGANASALRDFLSTELERPLEIVWIHSARSRELLGEREFLKLVGIFYSFVELEKDREKKFFFRLED